MWNINKEKVSSLKSNKMDKLLVGLIKKRGHKCPILGIKETLLQVLHTLKE